MLLEHNVCVSLHLIFLTAVRLAAEIHLGSLTSLFWNVVNSCVTAPTSSLQGNWKTSFLITYRRHLLLSWPQLLVSGIERWTLLTMLAFAVKQYIPVKDLYLMFGDKSKKKKNGLIIPKLLGLCVFQVSSNTPDTFNLVVHSANIILVWKMRKWKQRWDSESFTSHQSLVRGQLYQSDPIKDKLSSQPIKAEIRLGWGTACGWSHLRPVYTVCVFVPYTDPQSLSAINAPPDISIFVLNGPHFCSTISIFISAHLFTRSQTMKSLLTKVLTSKSPQLEKQIRILKALIHHYFYVY